MGPAAVAFDVVETLISLAPLGTRLEEVGLPAVMVQALFPRTLLYGLGLSVVGDYVPFPVAAADRAGSPVQGPRQRDRAHLRVRPAGTADV